MDLWFAFNFFQVIANINFPEFAVTLHQTMDWQRIEEFVRENASFERFRQIVDPLDFKTSQQILLAHAQRRAAFEDSITKMMMGQNVASQQSLSRTEFYQGERVHTCGHLLKFCREQFSENWIEIRRGIEVAVKANAGLLRCVVAELGMVEDLFHVV